MQSKELLSEQRVHGVHEYCGWEPFAAILAACEACYSKEGACLNKNIYKEKEKEKEKKKGRRKR